MLTPYRFDRRPDSPDARDFILPKTSTLGVGAPLPPSIDTFHGLKLPVYDQGSLGCHDDKTEVLTQLGWKPWAEYEGNIPLATIEPVSNVLTYQLPLALTRQKYSGPMYVSENKSANFCLTPNHRMYVRAWDERARTLKSYYSFQTAETLGWYTGLLSAPTDYVGGDIERMSIGNMACSGDDLCLFLSLFLSDGWVGGTEGNWNRISFSALSEWKYDTAALLAARIGFKEVPGRKGVWLRSDAELAQWLRSECFVAGQAYKAPFKRVPLLLRAMSKRQIVLFLSNYADRIGTFPECQFYTTSNALRDDLQELIFKAGHQSAIYTRTPRASVMKDGRVVCGQHDEHTINVRARKGISLGSKEHVAVEPYAGEVFCATVPNGILVTRREGRILISGNSCTANSGVLFRRFLAQRFTQNSAPDTNLSRMFLYEEERLLPWNNDPTQDKGAQIRDIFYVLAHTGVCPEKDDTYKQQNFDIALSAASTPVLDAAAYKIGAYHRLPDLDSIRGCLASGYALCFGFVVWSSFMQIGDDGVMSMPGAGDSIVGGHAVCVRGYDDRRSALLVQNSWGNGWGANGCFWMPYAFVLNYSVSQWDAWTGHLGKPWVTSLAS